MDSIVTRCNALSLFSRRRLTPSALVCLHLLHLLSPVLLVYPCTFVSFSVELHCKLPLSHHMHRLSFDITETLYYEACYADFRETCASYKSTVKSRTRPPRNQSA